MCTVLNVLLPNFQGIRRKTSVGNRSFNINLRVRTMTKIGISRRDWNIRKKLVSLTIGMNKLLLNNSFEI